MKRFQGTLAAVALLFVVGLVYFVARGQIATEPLSVEQERLFDFEKEAMRRVEIRRPDLTIVMLKGDDGWTVEGPDWRASRSMVRRVAHQFHDLTARAEVVQSPNDLDQYGLGDAAVQITLTLDDGSTVELDAGRPNATSVSYYVRPRDGDTVYIVKKAAVDYFSLELEEFRERRFASNDADAAQRIEAVVDGRSVVVDKVGDKRWHMSAPVDQSADRQKVRTMLGRTGALKASKFLVDHPTEAQMAEHGVAEPLHTIHFSLAGDIEITLHVGPLVPDTEPVECVIYRVEDDVIYQARCGFLEAYREEAEAYRNPRILGRNEAELLSMKINMGNEQVHLRRATGKWRWADDAAIPGSTPRRLGARAADVSVFAFHDDPPALSVSGLGAPYAVIEMVFADGARTLTLGKVIELPPDEEGRVDKRRYARLDGSDTVYEMHNSVASIVGDVFREHGRKLEKDREKHLLDEAVIDDTDAAGAP